MWRFASCAGRNKEPKGKDEYVGAVSLTISACKTENCQKVINTANGRTLEEEQRYFSGKHALRTQVERKCGQQQDLLTTDVCIVFVGFFRAIQTLSAAERAIAAAVVAA